MIDGAPTMGYDPLDHGLCNAQIVRELKSIEENQQLKWATQIKRNCSKQKIIKPKTT
jgi:hypothetical protein